MSVLKQAFLATLNHPGYKPWMKAIDLMVVIVLIATIFWWLL